MATEGIIKADEVFLREEPMMNNSPRRMRKREVVERAGCAVLGAEEAVGAEPEVFDDFTCRHPFASGKEEAFDLRWKVIGQC